MPYIIDGNNVIGCSPDLSLTDGTSRQKLITLVEQFQRYRKNSVILVFDGAPGEDSPVKPDDGRLSIVFPKEGDSADDLIVQIMSDYTTCRDVVLVSSDKKLKDFAKEKGGRALNAIEFYYDLKRANRIQDRKEEKEKRIHNELSDNEVDHWMKIFSDD